MLDEDIYFTFETTHRDGLVPGVQYAPLTTANCFDAETTPDERIAEATAPSVIPDEETEPVICELPALVAYPALVA